MRLARSAESAQSNGPADGGAIVRFIERAGYSAVAAAFLRPLPFFGVRISNG